MKEHIVRFIDKELYKQVRMFINVFFVLFMCAFVSCGWTVSKWSTYIHFF